MSKINPVMKNVAKIKTAEMVAIENFMDAIPPSQVEEGGVLIDNTITEVIAQPELSLDPIIDSGIAADNLEVLANDVDGITTAPALEAYKRIFTHMSQMAGTPCSVALEDFAATKGGVRKFAKTIRTHVELIRSCTSIALEDYIEKAEESVGSSLSDLQQVMKKLESVKADLDVPEGRVEVNHKSVWKLMHLDGKIIDMRNFGLEVKGIRELAELITKGKDKIVRAGEGDKNDKALDGNHTVKLMNNLTVTVKDGRVRFDHKDVGAPSKEWTGADFFWIFVFNWFGLAYRIIKGGSGDERTKKEECVKKVHGAIDELKKLGPVVAGIDKDIKTIKAAVDKDDSLRSYAAPVLELADELSKHITSVSYGMMRVFAQLH